LNITTSLRGVAPLHYAMAGFFPLLEVRIDDWAASDAREISTKWWMTIL